MLAYMFLFFSSPVVCFRYQGHCSNGRFIYGMFNSLISFIFNIFCNNNNILSHCEFAVLKQYVVCFL